MRVAVKATRSRKAGRSVSEAEGADLETLITAMGKRLQVEYIEGAIPYLRTHEPKLWATLESLDRDESIEALIEYEQLFFEGLRRYVAYLSNDRKAA